MPMDAFFANNTPRTSISSSLMGIGGLVALSVIHFVCGVILTVDVVLEIHTNLTDDQAEPEHGLFHLITEAFATGLLFFAFFLSSKHILVHRAALHRAKERLDGVRHDFAGLVQRRFHEWELSPAETETAMLTVKGLRIAEIATMRECSEATVKSHLTSIFRKSGTRSRPELLAHFVDDFLELSTDE